MDRGQVWKGLEYCTREGQPHPEGPGKSLKGFK